MRTLTITRQKRFVACMAAMQVYLESPNGDTRINNVPCIKLGRLKNGQTEIFSVPEEACRIFIIADKFTKNCCSEVYQLPAGTDPVSLTGKNRFRPFSGNPFYIDGNDSAEAQAHRKKSSRKFWVIMAIACLLGFLVGFAVTSGLLSLKPKVFTYDSMSITLDTSFRKTNYQGYTVCYDSSSVAVFCLEEKFSLMDGMEDLSKKEYAELVIQANQLKNVSATTSDGLTWFDYEWTNPETGVEYYYFSTVHKEKDAFWLIQFAVELENKAEYADQLPQWAKTVSFD